MRRPAVFATILCLNVAMVFLLAAPARAKKAPPPSVAGTSWYMFSSRTLAYSGALKEKSQDRIQYRLHFTADGNVWISEGGFPAPSEVLHYGYWSQKKAKIAIQTDIGWALIEPIDRFEAAYLWTLQKSKTTGRLKRLGSVWQLQFKETFAAFTETFGGKIKFESTEKGVATLEQ